MELERAELSKWDRFAAKGGIGKCTATCDYIAEIKGELMFMKGDEITVLQQFNDKEGQYLGYCEGVIGRFWGTDVVFHSKLKKPIMKKRGSTHSTLSAAQSNSPTPTTPTTPTIDRTTPPSSRPSSSRRTLGGDDLLSVTGDRRSQSQSPVRHIPANGNASLRRKSGGPQHNTPSPREFHFATAVNDDIPTDISTPRTAVESILDSPRVITRSPSSLADDDPVQTSITQFSTATDVTSPFTLPPSSPTTKEASNISAPAGKDQEGKPMTAPLRITKRTLSNPGSPLYKTAFPITSSDPSSPPSFHPSITDTSNSVQLTEIQLVNTEAGGSLSASPTTVYKVPPTLDLPSDTFSNIFSDRNDNQDALDELQPLSAPPSALDTSATADSTFDDLTTSHPGRFSRFSLGPALNVSALFGKSAQPPPQPPLKESEGGTTYMVGRASLSIAARGKVDEATLASTQAQVGIGLSLLQDLVGGMDSDSESGSDYEESDDGRTSHIKESSLNRVAEQDNHTVGSANSVRERVSTSEDIVTGLMYADREEPDHQQTDAVAHKRASGMAGVTTKSSFTARTSDLYRRTPISPTSPKVPQSPPHSAPGFVRRQQSYEASSISDSIRERRPSLAPSVVSGQSGTSGSWDDFYDSYRYSNFSTKSIAGRPSTDSIRTRTDSISGKLKSESITEEGFADTMDSAINSNVPQKTANRTMRLPDAESHQRPSQVIALDDSMYSQDSGLSNISREIAAITGESSTATRPTPLSIAGVSPLLHTNWSPESPPNSGLQTALPPLTAGLYTPHPGSVGSENHAKFGISLPTKRKEDGKKAEAGMASAMRQRLETERQSPLPHETHHDEENDVPCDNISVSEGLGNGIVVQDDEELPSKILADGDAGSDDGEGFSESHQSNIDGPIVDFPPEPLTMKDGKQEDRRFRKEDDFQPVSNNPHPLNSFQSPPMPMSQQGLSNSHQLRPRNTQPVGPEGRRSLFLPHPNAPKSPWAPLDVEPGAGIGAISQAYRRTIIEQDSTVPPVPSTNNLPSRPHPPVQAIIHMALTLGSRIIPTTPGKPPTHVLPTIYGRTEADLSTSIGPVPIVFSVEPPVASSEGKATAPKGVPLPPIGGGSPTVRDTGMKATAPPSHPASPLGQQATMVTQSPPIRTFSSFSSAINSTTRPATSPGTLPPTASNSDKKDDPSDKSVSSGKSTPIPRPNFVPKAPTLRPRSRSFSGFNSGSPGGQSLNSEEKQEPKSAWPKRNIPSLSILPSGSRSPIKTSPLRPSPLSISISVDTDVAVDSNLPSTMRGSTPNSLSTQNSLGSSRSSALSTTTSILNINREQGHRAQSISSTQVPAVPGLAALRQKNSGPPMSTAAPTAGDVTQAHTKMKSQVVPTDQPSLLAGSLTGKVLMEKHGTTTSDMPNISRQGSLRTKLSLPNMRKNRNWDDEAIGIYDREIRDAGGKLLDERSSLQGKDRPKEVVQIKDMEFELVRPSLSVQQRNSEDSLLVRRESPLETRTVDNSLLQPASPTISLSSSDLRSPILESYSSGNNPETSTPSMVQSSESVEAHRQRELKWVSMMSSSPASLSRKSKKVKKLLIEGVPSSVRYLIWSYLTDGKGRAVKGVYEQLCQRGQVTRTRDIAADAERLFGVPDREAGNDGTQYLNATKGAVIVLLQAYFSMVPDVRYSTGLAKIVGQLLLLAPEEDAFWIFTSIMDTHLRPYFSVPASINPTSVFRSTQMEVDAALYSRALEAADPPLSKKLFVDLGILPGVICQPWFTSLFVGSLPLEYINRVWDIFLYEGVPFLLRVALSLTFICRQFLLVPTMKTQSLALTALARPPTQWLPSSPEAFLATVMSVKLKDDDVRKQRIKMGEILKRQTQAQQGTTGVITSGISLPRV